MTMPGIEPRRTRSDGQRTREAILQAAASLATVEGLDRLSIGGLAEHIGISKSGLYAHFKSKEALQLETIASAWKTFDAEVVHPALTAPPGRATVLALFDEFLGHLERRVFPGGCFFAATMSEMHLRTGAVAAQLAEFDAYWLGLLREHIVLGQAAGQIGPEEDPDQLAFEIDSHVLQAHLRYPPERDTAILERARAAVRHRLGVPSGG